MNFKGLADLVKDCIERIIRPPPKNYADLGEIIYLDLNKTVLYTTQNSVNKYKVDSMIKGIELNDAFPPVFVSENPDGSYNLELVEDPFDSKNFGGNHRAVAHQKANHLLKCIRVKKSDGWTMHPISSVSLSEEDRALRTYLAIKKGDERYR